MPLDVHKLTLGLCKIGLTGDTAVFAIGQGNIACMIGKTCEPALTIACT